MVPLEAFLLLASAVATAQDLEPLKVDEKPGRVSFGAKAIKTDTHPQLKRAIEYLMGLYQGDATTLIVNPVPLMSGHRYRVNKQLLPKEGTPVKIIIESAK